MRLRLLLLGAAGLALSGCPEEEQVPGINAGAIDICAEVDEEFRCRPNEERIGPRLPYDFVAYGPDFTTEEIRIVLYRVQDGSEHVIHEMTDRVPSGSNAYVNNFAVTEAGRYRLEVRTADGRLYAERRFTATERRR